MAAGRNRLAPALLMLVVVLVAPGPALAAWPDGIWTSLKQSVGGADGRGAITDALVAFLRSQPEPAVGGVALAAHGGAEGHWTFVNRRGETFTVGTPDEMKRVVPALAPDAANAKSPLVIHLSPETVLDRAEMLKELPSEAELSCILAGRSFAVVRARDGGGKVRVAIRPRLHLEISERGLFEEAVHQLEQPVDKKLIRVLSLEPGGPETLARAPKPDPATGRSPGDVIDPFRLPAALSALSGQTAVISGRISGPYLAFRPSNGVEATILAADVQQAAARAGVDLLIIQSSTPHQPGTRNWLWQRFEIDGLAKAIDHATFGDFLATLAGPREIAVVVAADPGGHRIALTVNPPRANSGALGGLLQEMTAGITGAIAPSTVDVHLTKLAHRRELARRIVPIAPSLWQAVYAVALLIGIAGMRVSRRWWQRLWPMESREDYSGMAGYVAAKVIRTAAFALLFLPVAGLPSLLLSVFELFRRSGPHLGEPAQ